MLSGDDMAFKEGLSSWYEVFNSTSLGIGINAQSWGYQTFTPTRSHRLDYVSLCLYKQGAELYVAVSVYSTDNNHQPVGRHCPAPRSSRRP